jgi:DNA-binding NarL/FixJ family response regulator
MDRILIADDHPLVRSGIVALLSSAMPGCNCAEAASLAEAMAILADDPDFDLITLDLDLPDAKQLDALSELHERYPGIPIAILSGSRDTNLARAAVAAGAAGFVSKMQKPEVLLSALQAIREEGSYREPAFVSPDPEEQRVMERAGSLTPQQRAVFKLVVDGRLNKQIAYDLDISLTTVKAHVSAILGKLGVASRTQAVILAQRYNLFI